MSAKAKRATTSVEARNQKPKTRSNAEKGRLSKVVALKSDKPALSQIVAVKQPKSGIANADGLAVGLKHATRDKYASIVQCIGLSSGIARRIIEKLSDISRYRPKEIEPWFTLWQEHCSQYFDLPAAEDILAAEVAAPTGHRLFVAHSYCKIVLSELVHLLSPVIAKKAARHSLYDWVSCLGDAEIAELRAELKADVARTTDVSRFTALDCSDLLATVYQELLPPPLRHLLGEYYTPSWLVEYCIGLAEQKSPPKKEPLTVMDPAAGSGSFLAHYISHLQNAKGSKRPASVRIVGFDVNPLAVDFCHANALLAIAKSDDPDFSRYELSIHLTDAVVDPIESGAGPLFSNAGTKKKTILGTVFSDGVVSEASIKETLRHFRHLPKASSQFSDTLRQYVRDSFVASKKVETDVVVGNPPWITWDGLTREYRDRVAPQWSNSTLVTNSGWKAKVAAGKTDFSSLFVYRAAQRHAAPNAVMVFVLPMSLFQSRLAGAGFRNFQTVDGRYFAARQIDDFSDVKVFPDAANRTAVGTFVVDHKPQYPISYKTWHVDRARSGQIAHSDALGGPLDPTEGNSPLVTFDKGCTELKTIVGKSDYRARGGVNTGGANTILWLEVVERTKGVCTVRNVGKSRRSASNVVTAEVESEAVHPLLCGTDMQRWKAVAGKSIMLLYSADQPKKAMPIEAVKEKFPKALKFVSRFQTELTARKEYHRWGCSGPFYEVYRIGPYTFSPIKVVWQHTGYRKALNVSVVDDRGRQLTIPDQKAILIPFEDLEEAHYVCAFLSSSVTAGVLDRYLGTDASTHILDYVALRRFDPRNKQHTRLAKLSQQAHECARDDKPVAQVEREIDAIVGSLSQKE